MQTRLPAAKRLVRVISLALFILFVQVFTPLISGAAGLEKGDAAAAFSAADLQGNIVDIAPLIGKQVIVLKFGSIYCSSCVKSITTLAKLQEDHPEDKLKVVGINLDIYGVFRVKRFYRSYREIVNYPLVIDEALNVSRKYGVATLPSIIIIGKDGKIARTMIGYQESELEPIMEYARNLVEDRAHLNWQVSFPSRRDRFLFFSPLISRKRYRILYTLQAESKGLVSKFN